MSLAPSRQLDFQYLRDDNSLVNFLPVYYFGRGSDVTFQRPPRRLRTQLPGIALLILGLFRVPLPQADYHNLRHHDGAGEICPLHNHLLRWHPRAASEKDVAVLHWHWVLPQPQGSGERPDTGPAWPHLAPSPRLDAFLGDCLALDWSATLAVRPAPIGRSLLGFPSSPSAPHVTASFSLAVCSISPAVLTTGARSCSQGALRAELLGLFQHWNC